MDLSSEIPREEKKLQEFPQSLKICQNTSQTQLINSFLLLAGLTNVVFSLPKTEKLSPVYKWEMGNYVT